MYKNDFPVLRRGTYTFLDSAASAQKPDCVLDAMNQVYEKLYANVHRGSCDLALKTTDLYHQSREKVAHFIGAMADEVVFTHGATESLNMIAFGMQSRIGIGDEILISVAEHHANFVPWQQLCLKTGARLVVFNVLDSGAFDLDDFQGKLSTKTKIVAISHFSNVLGLLNPIDKIIDMAHQKGAIVVVDGAQSTPHTSIDVKKLDCDYFVFAGHKLYGPTGIGVLYGKKEQLSQLSPICFGGDMVENVAIEGTTFQTGVARFESGTPPFVEAIGLAASVDYVQKIRMNVIENHIDSLSAYCLDKLLSMPQIRLLGNSLDKKGVIAFTIDGVHIADAGFVVAKENVCVRVGHHCAMPVHTYFNTPLSMRISLGLYNTTDDIDKCINAIKKSIQFFK